MQFAVSVVGTHVEGRDAKARFDKIVAAFAENLHANGFIATSCTSSHDSERPAPEASPTPPELLGEEARVRGLSWDGIIIDDPILPPTVTFGERAARLTVDFASSAAAELADANDLTNTDFAGRDPSGDTGFTTFDVREAIKSKA